MRIESEGCRRVSRWLSAGAVLAVLCHYPSVSAADVLWNWSFSTEAGTFVTTGTFTQTSGAATFTFKKFSVSSSQIAANVGAAYSEGGQPIQTMSWNGSQPTQFTRGGGAFTNGSNFYNVSAAYRYDLGVPNGLLLDTPGNQFTTGPLAIVPVGDVAAQGLASVPVSSITGIACATVLMALGGMLSVRRQNG